jgi:hypothetical protein
MISNEVRTPVRLAMPDRWLECVVEIPLQTTVAEAKRMGLEFMLLRPVDNPDDFYVDFAEKRVRDEQLTLAALGVEPNSALFIRAYDLGHYPDFRG